MTNERNDDEVLGRALSRAIETQAPNETPYERSRIAVRPLRGGFPFAQFLGAAGVVLVLALAFGTWLTRPIVNEPVAAPASATAMATATASAPVGASAVPASEVPSQRMWAYFTREGLPPIGAFITVRGQTDTPDHRVLALLSSLGSVARSDTPAGTTNPLSQAGAYTGGYALSVGMRLTGDLATIELDAPHGWGIQDPYTRQLVQQLVYTATEEPGVRRVALTGQSGAALKIDQLVFDKILTRDDVSGYAVRASEGTTTFPGDDTIGPVGADLTSRTEDGTLVRLTFEGRDQRGTRHLASLPTMSIAFGRNDGSFPHNNADGPAPAYVLAVGFKWNGSGSSGGVGHVERIDRSPLRLFSTDGNTAYVFGLDDARPWRAYMPDAAHLVIEIGGDPRLVSDRIAVAQPIFDSKVGPSFVLSGSARVFEANVVWRIKDSAQKVVASGHTTASLGTSALWGTFETTVTLPPSVTVGRLTLEVYEASPKDGSEQGLVAIPINR